MTSVRDWVGGFAFVVVPGNRKAKQRKDSSIGAQTASREQLSGRDMLGGVIVPIFRVFTGAYKEIYFVFGHRFDAIRWKISEPNDKENANVDVLIKSKGRHGLRVARFSM